MRLRLPADVSLEYIMELALETSKRWAQEGTVPAQLLLCVKKNGERKLVVYPLGVEGGVRNEQSRERIRSLAQAAKAEFVVVTEEETQSTAEGEKGLVLVHGESNTRALRLTCRYKRSSHNTKFGRPRWKQAPKLFL